MQFERLSRKNADIKQIRMFATQKRCERRQIYGGYGLHDSVHVGYSVRLRKFGLIGLYSKHVDSPKGCLSAQSEQRFALQSALREGTEVLMDELRDGPLGQVLE